MRNSCSLQKTRDDAFRADPTLILGKITDQPKEIQLFPPPPSSASRGLNGQVKEIPPMRSSPESPTTIYENALQTTLETVPDSDSQHRKIRRQKRTDRNNVMKDTDDEPTEELDSLKLYLTNIGKIPIQTENHQEWGEEIFAGKIALQALYILSKSELLTISQKKRVTITLEEGEFLLLRLPLRIREVNEKLLKNNYGDDAEKAEGLRKLDMEFVKTISGNEELVKEILGNAKAIEDEDERQSMLDQFIQRQTKFASQGKQSWNNLIEHNLRLPVRYAKKYQRRGISYLDLIQYGNEGLMIAASDYDPRKDNQFSTYAHWWITQKIRRGIDNHGSMIRLPISVSTEIRKKRNALITSLQENAGKVDVMPDNLVNALKTQRVSSLDRPIDVEGTTLLDLVENRQAEDPQQILDKAAEKDILRQALAELNPKHRQILDLRFGLTNDNKMTFEEIAQMFGITRQGVQQLEKTALGQLSRSRHVQELHQLLDR